MGICSEAFYKNWIILPIVLNLPRLSQGRLQNQFSHFSNMERMRDGTFFKIQSNIDPTDMRSIFVKFWRVIWSAQKQSLRMNEKECKCSTCNQIWQIFYCTNQTKMWKNKRIPLISPESVRAVRWKGWDLWWERISGKIHFEFQVENTGSGSNGQWQWWWWDLTESGFRSISFCAFL